MGQCSWILCSKIPCTHSPLFQPRPSKAASSYTRNLLSSSSFWLSCSLSLLLLAILLSFPPPSGYPSPLPSANLPLSYSRTPELTSGFRHGRFSFALSSLPLCLYTSPGLWYKPLDGLGLPLEPNTERSHCALVSTALLQLKADPWHSMLGLALWLPDSPRLPFICRASR